MASTAPARKMKEEATCAICLNLMADPVSISCGHSYCHACIMDFLQNKSYMLPNQEQYCPQCRAPFQYGSLRPNKQLGSLIQAIKEMTCDVMCEEHGEKLHLFCEDEGQLICWRCERAPQHKGHNTALVEDVCQGYKEKLQEALTNLSLLNDEYIELKASTTKQISQWREKIDIQRKKIQSDFKNLQSFLHEEEKCCLWRLEREEEETLRRLKYNEENLEQKSHEMMNYVLSLEVKCQGSPQELLQDVKDTLNRSSAVKLETPEVVSLELNTVFNVPEIYFDFKKMLRRYQVSVTLDPDTAHPGLTISEDQRQVALRNTKGNFDASPGRFSASHCVLGCEGFTSGRHYFEVYVGEGTAWDLGVCRENVQRDNRVKQKPKYGFWTIRLCQKEGYMALCSLPTYLQLKEKPLVVGIFLDYEAGVVSFYNMTTGSHIFTFPKASFSGTLRPYFHVYKFSPLFLLSQDEE
ncbi:PREDICTED: tripartite motif-containing protein 38 [Chrysochloris asiatica]|uniref:Tripartite motif-containing protein 38 n=1 Tax=Chrysochloris asiatica TaxID=185453 RepID=A0A9B0TWZ7_CHRAS|nr:PREDICTED: tripartite motif-containing protein 38 [Chrysochloris asiatica]